MRQLPALRIRLSARAIRIKPGEIPLDSPFAKVEKAPKEFDIDMIRCIYCGLCERSARGSDLPAEGLRDHRLTRAEMVHNKAKLYELGGTLPKPIHKWDAKSSQPEGRE